MNAGMGDKVAKLRALQRYLQRAQALAADVPALEDLPCSLRWPDAFAMLGQGLWCMTVCPWVLAFVIAFWKDVQRVLCPGSRMALLTSLASTGLTPHEMRPAAWAWPAPSPHGPAHHPEDAKRSHPPLVHLRDRQPALLD